MAVHGPFRRAGGAGRIEPEAIVFRGCRHGFELRLTLREQRGERLPFALGAQNVTWRPRGGRNGRFDLAGKFRGVDDRGRAEIVDHESVAACPQQCVERNRHDSGFDRAPEQIEKRRAVLHHHQHAFTALKPEAHKAVGATINVGGQFGVCDRAVGGADRYFGAAALGNVPVDERNRHVVIGREAQARRTLRSIYFNGYSASLSACFSVQIQWVVNCPETASRYESVPSLTLVNTGNRRIGAFAVTTPFRARC